MLDSIIPSFFERFIAFFNLGAILLARSQKSPLLPCSVVVHADVLQAAAAAACGFQRLASNLAGV